MSWRRPGLLWVALALALDAVIAVADARSDDVTLSGAFLLAPLALAVVERARVVAAVGALSVALALVSGFWNDSFGTLDHVLRVGVVLTGTALAVLAAVSRRAAVAARSRMELLAEVGRVADEAPSPEEAVRLLGSVLVPGLADAAAIDDATGRRLLDRPAVDVARTLTLPLARGEREVGALILGWRAPRATEADPSFARVLAGRVALVLSNAQLIAEVTSTRERLDRTLGALAEAVTVQDAEGRTVYVNEAAVRLLGASSPDELLSGGPGKIAARFSITKEDGSPVALEDLPGWHAVRDEEPEPLLTRTVERTTGRARWLLTKATAVRDTDGSALAVNVIEDVTEVKEAERRQRFLAEAGAVLAGSLDYQETLDRVARLSVPALAEWCAVDVTDERGALQRVALAHTDPEKVRLGDELNRRYPPDLTSDTGLGGVLRSGQPALYEHITDEMLAESAADPEHARMLREIGLRSAMLVPMRTAGRTTGVITFVDGARSFDADDLAFAQDLALLASLAVENSRIYTERKTASETLQESLLPVHLPDVPGWRTATSYQAGAPGVEVGGDFYDVFGVPGGHMVVLGDVTGKGVKAAALTSLVRYTARTAAMFDQRPTAVLRLLNRVLRDQPEPAFVTVVCARLDPAGMVTVASAGHPLPLRAGAAGGAMEVGAHGILLGATGDADWGESFARLVPGDTLLFYTDGITETPGREGRFGEQRLAELVADAPRDPVALLRTIDSTLESFQSDAVLDDRAMLAVHYTGTPETVVGGPTLAGVVRSP